MRRALALVLAVAALPSCSAVGLGDGGDHYTLTAWFPRAVSLYAEADVRVLGVDSGSIKSVEPVGDAVRVELSVDADVRLPADVRATIVPLSLIGERYVQLFPPWTEGPRAGDGDVVPLERTSVPVEPDEALEAVKHLLDSLDPDATGRLVRNLADAVEGNGDELNRALAGLATVAGTLASRDEEIGRLIEQFDRFTATLATREQELGAVLDAFATTTRVLAAERREIEGLLRGLASTSSDLLDLVGEHKVRLDADLVVLTRTLQSARVNIEQVEKLLDTSTPLINGLYEAWAPLQHRIDLRTQYSPTAGQAIGSVVPGLGGDVVCLPADVDCEPTVAPARREPGGPTGFLRRAAGAVLGVGG